MTAAQLARRNESYRRETSRAYATFLLPSFVFVPVIVGLVSFASDSWRPAIASAVLGVAWFILGLFLLRRGAYWRVRALGLLCPSCAIPLIPPGSRIDPRGNCRDCGTDVIDSSESAERALFTRVEFAHSQANALRVQRGLAGGLVVLLMVVAIGLPVVLTLKLWPRSLGGPEIWFTLATFGLVVGGGIVGSMLETGQRRRALLECPDCRAQLVDAHGATALAGGRCPGCGLLIVDDAALAAPAPPAAPATRAGARPPPASAAELRERDERLEHGTRREYAIVLPLAIAGLVVAQVGLHVRASASFYLWMILGCTAMIGVLLYASKIWERRARRLGLACPLCDELLVGGPGSAITHFVAEQGTCKFCGAILWGPSAAAPSG